MFSGKVRLSSRRSSRVKGYVREKKKKTRGPPGAKSEKESKSKHESPTLVLVWLRYTATSRMVPKRKLRRTDRETHWYCLIECLIRHRQMTGSSHLFCEFSFHVSFSPLMQLVVQLLQLSSFSFFNSVKPELPSRVSRLRSEILKHTKHFTEGVQRNSISSNSNVQFFTAINSVSIPQLFFFFNFPA